MPSRRTYVIEWGIFGRAESGELRYALAKVPETTRSVWVRSRGPRDTAYAMKRTGAGWKRTNDRLL